LKAPDIFSFRDLDEVLGWRYSRSHYNYSGGGDSSAGSSLTKNQV